MIARAELARLDTLRALRLQELRVSTRDRGTASVCAEEAIELVREAHDVHVGKWRALRASVLEAAGLPADISASAADLQLQKRSERMLLDGEALWLKLKHG